jgi:hypothetical protein
MGFSKKILPKNKSKFTHITRDEHLLTIKSKVSLAKPWRP